MNKIKLVLILSLSFFTFYCAPPSNNRPNINYYIKAQKDPLFQLNGPKTYKITMIENGDNTLIEKNLLYILSNELDSLGWEIVDNQMAEFIFSVDYSIVNSKVFVRERKNPKSTQYTPPAATPPKDGYTPISTVGNLGITSIEYVNVEKNGFNKNININVYSVKTGELVWSVTCKSIGLNDNIILMSQQIIPWAIRKFPSQGIWQETKGIWQKP